MQQERRFGARPGNDRVQSWHHHNMIKVDGVISAPEHTTSLDCSEMMTAVVSGEL